MGITYHFTFKAPATRTATELETFLRGVEKDAQAMGFKPTMVLNAVFDTAERKQFARRLTTGWPVEDERLRGADLPDDSRVWHHNPSAGTCRVPPIHGVVLVVTDEHACETVFGFFKFPDTIKDTHRKTVLNTGLKGCWAFRDHIKSPDKRYREIVKTFATAGYLKEVVDEF